MQLVHQAGKYTVSTESRYVISLWSGLTATQGQFPEAAGLTLHEEINRILTVSASIRRISGDSKWGENEQEGKQAGLYPLSWGEGRWISATQTWLQQSDTTQKTEQSEQVNSQAAVVLRAQVKDRTYCRWRTEAIACMHIYAHATTPCGRLIVIHTHNDTDWGQREQRESEERQVLPLEDRRACHSWKSITDDSGFWRVKIVHH